MAQETRSQANGINISKGKKKKRDTWKSKDKKQRTLK